MGEPGICAQPPPWRINSLVLHLSASSLPDADVILSKYDLTTWFAPPGSRMLMMEKVRVTYLLRATLIRHVTMA